MWQYPAGTALPSTLETKASPWSLQGDAFASSCLYFSLACIGLWPAVLTDESTECWLCRWRRMWKKYHREANEVRQFNVIAGWFHLQIYHVIKKAQQIFIRIHKSMSICWNKCLNNKVGFVNLIVLNISAFCMRCKLIYSVGKIWASESVRSSRQTVSGALKN